jgi:ABC-type multidrug transport system fused ATPase/permease subunit
VSHIPAIFTSDRRGHFAAVIATGVGEALAIGVAAFSMRDVFAALYANAEQPTTALVTLGLCALAVALFRVANRTVSERLGQRYAMSARATLYEHLAGQPLSQIEARRSGALALRFVGDMTALRNWASKGLTRIITAAIVLPGAAAALWIVNPALAYATFIPLLMLCGLMLAAARVLAPIHGKLRSRRAKIAIEMMERAHAAPLLDRMGRTATELKNLDRRGAELTSAAVHRASLWAMLRNLPEIGVSLAALATIMTAFAQNIPAAQVAAALAMIAILVTTLRDLADVWDQYSAWRIAREKFEGVLRKPSVCRRPGNSAGGVAIHFHSASFRGINADLSIAAGELVMLSAPAGRGKSSLLALAAGLEQPAAGEVRFGEGDASPRAVLIGSAAPILQGSLRRALSLGAPRRPNDGRIEDVARGFGLGPLIERTGGLQSRIAESGRTLSDGEIVRIHMARAQLSGANIIVVDTPLVEADDTLKACIDTLHKETGATTLVASVGRNALGRADRCITIHEDGAVKHYSNYEACPKGDRQVA